MVPDYDAADAAPASEQVASTYEDVEEDAPWKDIECELRPAALHALGPSKFIRAGALLANQDIKTYDAGSLFLNTVDGTAVNWGKLWVEYDVTLMTPQLPPGGGGAISAQAMNSSAPTSAAMLAAPTTASSSSAIVTVAGEVLTFLQAGNFTVVYNVAGTTCTQTGAPAPSGAALAYIEVAGSGTSSMSQTLQLLATVGETLTFNNTLVAGTQSMLYVSQNPVALASL
jgi:hypothetical protein